MYVMLSSSRSIVQLEPVTKEEIRCFESVREASRVLKIERRGITLVLNGRSKTTHGSVFQYADGGKPEPSKKRSIPVADPKTKNGRRLEIEQVLGIEQQSIEQIQMGSRSIFQIDPETKKVVRYFESVHEASRELNINRRRITKVLNGSNKTAHGFTFQYVDGGIPKPCKKKEIYEFNLSGSFLRKYESISEVVECAGFPRSQIKRILQGKRKHIHGRIFRDSNSLLCNELEYLKLGPISANSLQHNELKVLLPQGLIQRTGEREKVSPKSLQHKELK